MRRILVGFFLLGCIGLLVGGVSVKRGPAGASVVHSDRWYFNATDKPAVDECAYTYTHADFGPGACGVISQSAVAVYEPDHSAVTIHRVQCYYYSNGVAQAGDSLQVCAAYQAPGGALTTTTTCATLATSANTYETAVSTSKSSVAANDFGLHLRVGAITDADGNSDWKGTCTIVYSGAN